MAQLDPDLEASWASGSANAVVVRGDVSSEDLLAVANAVLAALWSVPHPDQPDEPLLSYASSITVGDGEAGFWVDAKDLFESDPDVLGAAIDAMATVIATIDVNVVVGTTGPDLRSPPESPTETIETLVAGFSGARFDQVVSPAVGEIAIGAYTLCDEQGRTALLDMLPRLSRSASTQDLAADRRAILWWCIAEWFPTVTRLVDIEWVPPAPAPESGLPPLELARDTMRVAWDVITHARSQPYVDTKLRQPEDRVSGWVVGAMFERSHTINCMSEGGNFVQHVLYNGEAQERLRSAGLTPPDIATAHVGRRATTEMCFRAEYVARELGAEAAYRHLIGARDSMSSELQPVMVESMARCCANGHADVGPLMSALVESESWITAKRTMPLSQRRRADAMLAERLDVLDAESLKGAALTSLAGFVDAAAEVCLDYARPFLVRMHGGDEAAAEQLTVHERTEAQALIVLLGDLLAD